MECNWRNCKEKATVYISWVYEDKRGQTQHADFYDCDNHADLDEAHSTMLPNTIEFERKALR